MCDNQTVSRADVILLLEQEKAKAKQERSAAIRALEQAKAESREEIERAHRPLFAAMASPLEGPSAIGVGVSGGDRPMVVVSNRGAGVPIEILAEIAADLGEVLIKATCGEYPRTRTPGSDSDTREPRRRRTDLPPPVSAPA